MSNEQKQVFAEMIEEFCLWLTEQMESSEVSAWLETEIFSPISVPQGG